ncbi:hypothetical protein ACSBR2_037947 [Camellia fascicularis]
MFYGGFPPLTAMFAPACSLSMETIVSVPRSVRGSVAARESLIHHPSAGLVDWKKSIRIRPSD